MSQQFSIIDINDYLSTSRITINNSLLALKSSFSGADAPASPELGQLWYDTTNRVLRIYTDAGWRILQNGSITTLNVSTSVNIAAPSIGSVVLLNGSGTIQSFGTTQQLGTVKFLIIGSSGTTITNNANILTPTSTNITLNEGDIIIAIAATLDSNNNTIWRIFSSKHTNSLFVNGNIYTTGNLTIDGDITLGNSGVDSITIRGDVAVKDNSGSTTKFYIENDTGNTTIGGTLGVTGNTTIGGTLSTGSTTVTGNTTIGGTLSTGSTTVNGDLTVSGNTTLGDAGTDAIIIRGDVYVKNDANSANTFTVDNNTGNTVINGTLSTGSTIVNGNLSVTGNTTLGDAGTDAITIRGDLFVRNDANSANTFTVDNNTGAVSASVFTSTAESGTSPLNIISTTRVTNLNADLLDGYHAGNSSGQVAVNNGTVNVNLNADLLDGFHANTGTAANTIPVRDGSGNIPGNITGNADLLDGFHASQTAQANTIIVSGSDGKISTSWLPSNFGGLGYGQTWQQVSRNTYTNYTNDTGKPIAVLIYANTGGEWSDIGLSINSNVAYGVSFNWSSYLMAIVPPNSYYSFNFGHRSRYITSWRIYELR